MNINTKIFGTDGIRGRAGVGFITPEFMIKIPSAIASLNNFKTRRVVIGKDTRISCYSIENALTAGFTANGFEVILTGPIPTPAISMLTRSLRADYGIMISASHNPYYDNGIKIFGNDGVKISREIEEMIESYIDSRAVSDYNHTFGRARRLDDVIGRYVEYIKSSIQNTEAFVGLKVLLDVANGSAYKIAPEIFWELGCSVKTYNNFPNGVNINENCGATHPEFLASIMKKEGADIGIILDGDADRLIVIDENGEILDGDNIIAGIVCNLKAQGKLEKNGVVVTVMSNLGFENYVKSIGIEEVIRTDVGDKNVSKALIETGFQIGGEQSGHIILPQYSSTGDGILSAIQLISAMKSQNWKASDVGKLYEKSPQVLHNIINETATNEQMETISAKYSNEMTRVLVRRSGTEHSKVRIMVEGNGDLQEIAKKIEKELGE
jgi:phosphoglucosamine mutase